MELENLKNVWKEVSTNAVTTSPRDLEQLLSKRSKSPIAKMKRNLFVEMITVVVLYVTLIVYYFIMFNGVMLVTAWMLVVVGIFYMIYYLRKRKLLLQMECVTCEVKSNLSMQLTVLEKYVRFYLISGTLLFPVAMIIVSVAGYFYNPLPPGLPTTKEKFFIYYLAGILLITAPLTVPVYFLNKWYVNKLYGQHVNKLRQIVNEMNELPFH